MNADGSGVVQLTDNEYNDGAPAWSPDGGRIAFNSDHDGVNLRDERRRRRCCAAYGRRVSQQFPRVGVGWSYLVLLRR